MWHYQKNIIIMKIKLTLFVAFFAIIAFTSCEDNPLEGTFVDETGIGNPSASTDAFFANIGGTEFIEDVISVSTVTTGAIEYVSIVASKTGGDQIGINIPVAHTNGVYNFTNPLETASVSGAYIVTGVTNVATLGTLTITGKTASHIEGTFNFTASSNGNTYQITDGAFSIDY